MLSAYNVIYALFDKKCKLIRLSPMVWVTAHTYPSYLIA